MFENNGIGGDFNAVVLHDIDRIGVTASRDQRLASIALQKWSNDYGVIDTWRMMNTSSRQLSFFSARHNTFSRIAYIFASKTLFTNIRRTEMTQIALLIIGLFHIIVH